MLIEEVLFRHFKTTYNLYHITLGEVIKKQKIDVTLHIFNNCKYLFLHEYLSKVKM